VTVNLIDEAWAKVDPQTARNQGYAGIIGYVSQDDTGKNLTADDAARIHGVGLDVGLVYEYNPQSALGGLAQGWADAGIAVAHARSIGAPAGTCLYAAVDFNASTGELGTIYTYALGYQATVQASGYRAGVYAGFPVVDYLAKSGYTGLLWQTYAWSESKWSDRANVRQVANGIIIAGADVDRDEAETPDWGQWPPSGQQEGAVTMGQYGFASELDGPYLAWRGDALATGATEVRDGPGKGEHVWIVQQLIDIKTELDKLSATVANMTPAASGLTDDDRAALGQLNNLLGQVAAHIK
jgi:glycoside hydrolase-like protein